MSEAKTHVVIHWKGAALVWALSLVFVIGVGVAGHSELRFSVLSAGAALVVSVAFFVQMLGGSSEGYINRVAASIAGAFLIFAVAGGIFALSDALAG